VILLWRLIALVCLALGCIGLALPIMPTVPFLLLAAAAASRGWPWLDQRLVRHPVYGPFILQWRQRRAIPRRAKWLATWSMGASCVLIWFTPVPLWVAALLPLPLLAVGAWIWARPEG
jgi:hypothetical protein